MTKRMQRIKTAIVGASGYTGSELLRLLLQHPQVELCVAGAIGRFVSAHPTIKMLALSFLLLIGVTLIAEGFHQHIPKGYIYFAMAFSVLVEFLNMRLRRKGSPVELHDPYHEDGPEPAKL